MAPRKKKAPANKNTATVNMNPSAGIIGNMYRGLSSSTPAPEVRTDSSGDVLRSILGSGRGFGGLSFGSVTPPSGGSNPQNPVWTKTRTINTATGPVDVDANGIAQDGSTPVEKTDGGGNVSNDLSASEKDAFALIEETFRLYNLESMIPSIKKLMTNNVGPNQASLMLKTDPNYNTEYVKRFAGNKARVDAGLNALSEAEYLDLESSYMQTLRAYGQANYFGVDKAKRMEQMSTLIGSDVSAVEFKDRIDTVVSRVTSADPAIKATMSAFFGIKEEDLVSYFLNPKENLPKLQEKVTAAEIGAAARGQDLATSADAATALARYGITQAQAREGYSTIGDVLPTARKLGEIYGDIYTQETAEQEVFKGSASAKRKREQLAQREAASFAGSSGRLRTGQMQGNTGSF